MHQCPFKIIPNLICKKELFTPLFNHTASESTVYTDNVLCSHSQTLFVFIRSLNNLIDIDSSDEQTQVYEICSLCLNYHSTGLFNDIPERLEMHLKELRNANHLTCFRCLAWHCCQTYMAKTYSHLLLSPSTASNPPIKRGKHGFFWMD